MTDVSACIEMEIVYFSSRGIYGVSVAYTYSCDDTCKLCNYLFHATRGRRN
jgi:hypothetical protein